MKKIWLVLGILILSLTFVSCDGLFQGGMETLDADDVKSSWVEGTWSGKVTFRDWDSVNEEWFSRTEEHNNTTIFASELKKLIEADMNNVKDVPVFGKNGTKYETSVKANHERTELEISIVSESWVFGQRLSGFEEYATYTKD